jgi:hypothetical protein
VDHAPVASRELQLLALIRVTFAEQLTDLREAPA